MHEPVLINQVVDLLKVERGGIYVDGTVGSGGHAEAILRAAGPDGFLVGIDRDGDAIARSEARLGAWSDRLKIVHGNYSNMSSILKKEGIGPVNGVLLDLGVSSEQLDTPGRGFSVRSNGPLDMRMNENGNKTASDLVNELPEERLEEILRVFGEERRSRRIAKNIVLERGRRRIETTLQLAEVVARGARHSRIHPATRAFQALRIAVNDELVALDEGLVQGLDILADGGRLAVISFHSLEDRRVKNFMKQHRGQWVSLQAGGREWQGILPAVRIMTKKPVTASDEEVAANPRSRSAKLRVVEKIAA